MDRILVIEAGAAGLFAALTAARRGREVLVVEKMPRPRTTRPRHAPDVVFTQHVPPRATNLPERPALPQQ